jgi:hypothetical protein
MSVMRPDRAQNRIPQLVDEDRLQDDFGAAELSHALHRGGVGIARHEYDRNGAALSNDLSRLNAVRLAAKPNVHQDDVRFELVDQSHRIASGHGNRNDVTAKLGNAHGHVHGDQSVVLDDKEAKLASTNLESGAASGPFSFTFCLKNDSQLRAALANGSGPCLNLHDLSPADAPPKQGDAPIS